MSEHERETYLDELRVKVSGLTNRELDLLIAHVLLERTSRLVRHLG